MPPFKFRAQPVLEIRKRAEEAAERALAHAEGVWQQAEAARTQAARDVETALERAGKASASATHAGELTWYRNWITGQQRLAADRLRVATERRADRDRAQAVAERARRERMALDKLRDRAWRAHLEGERRAEQKDLDMLGTLKHAAARHEAGGDE
ncbi:MAG: flagellar FliJ family protein [Vicinamibacterales bacterium]|nr:flagellar FliJ family protein [Vicinamibacterales bacterium]